jgi:phage protein D
VVEYLDGKTLDFGKRLQVSLGPPGTEKIVFTGVISALEADFSEGDAPTIVVYAEDELMRLRLTQRSATYLKVTDADLLRTIASKHGLSAKPDVDGPTYDVVQQFNQSDLAFLRERARRIQAELWADDGALRLTTRDRRPGTTATLTRGGDLISLVARTDLSEQCTAVRAAGYDALSRESIDAEAPASTVNAEISGGRTGPQTLQRAFGDLPGRLIRDVPVAESEARAYARAEMLGRSRRFVRVRGVTSGTPQLVVGSQVTLSRCGKPFDGSGYYVTGFRHTYDLQKGMRTHFDAERPTVNPS